jgi:hypothetical protein
MGISVCNTSSKVNSKETLENKRLIDQEYYKKNKKR